MSGVEFDNVSKVYGQDIVAVDDFSMSIESGDFVTIVGPSGSGKSTLLRMVAGLEDITGGTIRLGERVLNDVQPQERDIAMVFQNYALYPHMTVEKNISYGLRLKTDLSEEKITERVHDTADMLGIENLLQQMPSNLSGGQQQRVATGRAIVREPEVFLMDEPLSNLDAKLRLHLRTELQRIQEDLDTTTIYVTHDQEEAMTMSDRVVVLNHGELQQIADPETLYDEPANRFVADFIGSPSMNFFDAVLDSHTLEGDGFRYPLPDQYVEPVRTRKTSDQVVLGVRPEDIEIVDSAEASVEATVDVIEPVGSDYYIYAHVGGGECTIRTSTDTAVEEGDEISLRFNPERLHVFDAETDENLTVSRTD